MERVTTDESYDAVNIELVLHFALSLCTRADQTPAHLKLMQLYDKVQHSVSEDLRMCAAIVNRTCVEWCVPVCKFCIHNCVNCVAGSKSRK